MNPTPSTPTQSLQVSTPTDTTIVLTRTFNAPRRLVWEAMTVPSKMRRWMMPPPGWTITICECDARVGGVLNLAFASADGGSVMTLKGVFTEVMPHERMVHTETMAMGTGEVIGRLVETHEFAEKSGATTVRITQVYEAKEGRDGALASGMDEGMEACYKKMDAMFAGRV